MTENLSLRVADLRDWPALERFYDQFKDTKWMARLDCDIETLEGFFKLALHDPRRFAILLVVDAGEVAAAALLMEVGTPYKLRWVQRSFIHGILTDPHRSRNVGRILHEGMVKWGQERGHDLLYGNIRMPHGAHPANGFKLRAVEKQYGMEAIHVILASHIPPKEV